MLTMKRLALAAVVAGMGAAALPAPASAALTVLEIREALCDLSARGGILDPKARVRPLFTALNDSTLAVIWKRRIILCPGSQLNRREPDRLLFRAPGDGVESGAPRTPSRP